VLLSFYQISCSITCVYMRRPGQFFRKTESYSSMRTLLGSWWPTSIRLRVTIIHLCHKRGGLNSIYWLYEDGCVPMGIRIYYTIGHVDCADMTDLFLVWTHWDLSSFDTNPGVPSIGIKALGWPLRYSNTTDMSPTKLHIRLYLCDPKITPDELKSMVTDGESEGIR
jgi:hypothetical protein